jgi:hypothetical protein
MQINQNRVGELQVKYIMSGTLTCSNIAKFPHTIEILKFQIFGHGNQGKNEGHISIERSPAYR